MKRLSLWTALLVGAAGCSHTAIGGRPSAATPTVRSDAATTDSTTVASPVVQVRGFSHSAIVSVVAWDSDEAEFGLRASVNRAGVLVGDLRFDDHRLYVTPLFARANGGFKYAADTLGHLLLKIGAQRDVYSCFYASDCSPMTTLGVRVPDSLLRTNRDSLVVLFFPIVGEPWTLTLRHELIAAYLTKVDSVVSEMRKTGTM